MQDDVKLQWINWDYIPAIIVGHRAWVLHEGGKEWTPINLMEVSYSGSEVPKEKFDAIFWELQPYPPLPEDALKLLGRNK